MVNKKYIGQKFGKLTVINATDNLGKLLCQCDCGNQLQVSIYKLNNGIVNQCEQCAKLNGQIKNKVYNYIDLTNKRFGKLLVIEPIGKDKQNALLWKCQCDCGNSTIVRGYQLRHNRVKSCGCKIKESKVSNISGLATYYTRISKLKLDIIYPEWKDRKSFYNWCTQTGYRKGMYLRLYDNSKSYSPKNCYWSTSNLKYPLIDSPYGKVSFKQLSKLSGIPRCSLQLRYKNGFRGEELLKTHYHSTLLDTPYGKVTFTKLSQLTGISKFTLISRYNSGKRDIELIKPSNRIVTGKRKGKYYLLNTPYGELTYKELSKITGLAECTIHERFKQAILTNKLPDLKRYRGGENGKNKKEIC